MNHQARVKKIISSALWSGYGDALGFMSELTDKSGLRHRIGSDRITGTVAWRRRIGGRFGVNAELPAGTYSDDTQLRLATGRAIRGDGSFDIQAFARVELPVWSSYALGAGRGTRAAASNLAKEGVAWFSNFFQDESVSYTAGGGNGAAMRIHPHVWAASLDAKPSDLILPVVQNTISTHGHPRAIVGALLHAFCVHFALSHESCPSITDLREMLAKMDGLADIMDTDGDISLVWVPTWEDRTGQKLERAIAETLQEAVTDLDKIAQLAGQPDEKYLSALQATGCLEDTHRGSGLKTAILAAFLAHEFSSGGHQAALLTAANTLQSDTDSIASMAGAILGAASNDVPEGHLVDRAYIETEARRLAEIGTERKQGQFKYPDLFKWSPPKTQLDAVYSEQGKLYVSGLGAVVDEGMSFQSESRPTESWQLLKMEFGQTLFIKRRHGSSGSRKKVASAKTNMPTVDSTETAPSGQQLSLSGIEPRFRPERFRSIDELTSEAISQSFNPAVIGKHLLELSEGSNGIEKATAYAAIIAKARISRKNRKQ